MTNSRLDDVVDVSRYVAETASRLNERLADVSSDIRRSLEEDIPELRGDAGVVELLGASVEGNVDTILRALRYDIAVQRVEARPRHSNTRDGWHNTAYRSTRSSAPTG